MKGRYWIAAMAIAVFAAVVWYMDPFLLVILGVEALVWVGLPTALLAALLLLHAICTGRSWRPALIILSAVVGFGCFFGLAVPANYFVQQCAVAAAKEYPVRVAPLLETYRQTHGSYPTSLDQIPTKPTIPRLLRSSYSYRSDGHSYSFCFGQPGGLIDTWTYSSETQTWHLST